MRIDINGGMFMLTAMEACLVMVIDSTGDMLGGDDRNGGMFGGGDSNGDMFGGNDRQIRRYVYK